MRVIKLSPDDRDNSEWMRMLVPKTRVIGDTTRTATLQNSSLAARRPREQHSSVTALVPLVHPYSLQATTTVDVHVPPARRAVIPEGGPRRRIRVIE